MTLLSMLSGHVRQVDLSSYRRSIYESEPIYRPICLSLDEFCLLAQLVAQCCCSLKKVGEMNGSESWVTNEQLFVQYSFRHIVPQVKYSVSITDIELLLRLVTLLSDSILDFWFIRICNDRFSGSVNSTYTDIFSDTCKLFRIVSSWWINHDNRWNSFRSSQARDVLKGSLVSVMELTELMRREEVIIKISTGNGSLVSSYLIIVQTVASLLPNFRAVFGDIVGSSNRIGSNQSRADCIDHQVVSVNFLLNGSLRNANIVCSGLYQQLYLLYCNCIYS